MGLRLGYWHSHFDYFPDNVRGPSKKNQGESYHQGFERDAKKIFQGH